MSTDFGEIMAAMASVPDIIIDPNTGQKLGSTGKTLGETYEMEDKVSPAMADKMREHAKLNEAGKVQSKNTVDAYREMIGVPTSKQIEEEQAQQMADALLEQHFNQLVKQNQELDNLNTLNENVGSVEDSIMDMYVNSINKKQKWSKN
jgi:uncharacterized protein with von Willebrand factor type A (vWA) domain